MHNFISPALAWLRAMFAPRGRHRAAPSPHLTRTSSAYRHTAPTPPTAPHAHSVPPRPALPAHRSPYGLDTPLDGGEVALIRPYLTGREEWLRQRHRTPSGSSVGSEPLPVHTRKAA